MARKQWRDSYSEEPEKRRRLTLAALAAYDDVATDVMVDQVCTATLLPFDKADLLGIFLRTDTQKQEQAFPSTRY